MCVGKKKLHARRAFWLLGLAFAGLQGCGRGESDALAIPGRLIAEPPSRRLELASFYRGERLRAESWQRARRRAWLVDLEGELRAALPAVPGEPIVRRLAVPTSGGRLRLAVGVLGEPRSRYELRVLVGSRGGAQELWRGRPEPRWRDLKLSLDAFAGQEVELRLEADAPRLPWEPAHGLPVCGHPEVVPAEGDAALAVLLISVDTLRADRLSLLGYSRPTSPRIDAWAEASAVIFPRAVAAAPWTLPAHVSMLTGLDAARHGRNHDVGGAGVKASLAEILRAEGWATAASTGGGYLHPRYGFARGFDAYAYQVDRDAASVELAEGVDRALRWLAERRAERRFFFLHTYAVHAPYRAHQPFFERLTPELAAPEEEVAPGPTSSRAEEGFEQRGSLVWRSARGEERPLGEAELPMLNALYDSGVAAMDAELGRLFASLRELDLDRQTLIVLTSDHGEALGEQGLRGHTHLYESTSRVPLLIAFPNRRAAGQRLSGAARTVDILPTLLEALDILPPPDLDGRSLLPAIEGRGMVPSIAWSYASEAGVGMSLRLGGLKYIFNNSPWPPTKGREELYEIDKDAAESLSLAPRDPRLPELRRRMDTYLRAVPGVELRLVNRHARSLLQGRLRGPSVLSSRLKVLRTPSPGRLRFERPGSAAFELRDGESSILRFEQPEGRWLRLEGFLEVDEERFPYAFELEPLSLEEPWALSFVDGGWEDGEAGRRSRGVLATLAARLVGAPAELAGTTESADPELRERLRALGYAQ